MANPNLKKKKICPILKILVGTIVKSKSDA
jgi:hypothetical protein